MDVLDKIRGRSASVAVLGLGYVGLPLALEFAEAGFTVYGIDVSAEKTELLRQGKSYIRDVPPQRVKEALASGKLRLASEPDALALADAVVICVPTPIKHNQQPDLSYIQASVETIKPRLHPQMLIVLESTTYPGTTEECLEKEFRQAGYVPGQDYYLCYSPERIDPGNRKYGIRNTPKVIGGTTDACLAAGKALYETVADRVVTVSSPKAAEMTKLLENTFRSVNIGFVNEMARLSEELGIDIWEVIAAASSKPFGFMPFYPGPGIGGHCIPLDPLFLAWRAKRAHFYSKFIELAQESNQSMPRYVVHRLMEILNDYGKCLAGSRLLLLGMAYKPDQDDLRESPNLEIFGLLADRGAAVDYHDFYIESFTDESGIKRHSIPELTEERLSGYDCVVILTAHRSYDFGFVVRHSRAVFDCRNASAGLKDQHVYRLGAK
jgi:UDP-N-acetyl-D-glucosamine dehydrogenase